MVCSRCVSHVRSVGERRERERERGYKYLIHASSLRLKDVVHKISFDKFTIFLFSFSLSTQTLLCDQITEFTIQFVE